MNSTTSSSMGGRTLGSLGGSSYGYTTSQLVDRDTRNALRNRDRREAAMVTGVAPLKLDPTASRRESAGFLSETDRLRTNAERDLKKSRETERARQQTTTEHLRSIRQTREDQRQTNMRLEHERAVAEGAALAGTSLRNVGSVPYHIISHAFTSDEAKRRADYEAQWTKHSFMTRTAKLEKALNPAGYNVVNGLGRTPIAIPPRPDPLPELLGSGTRH